MIAKIPADWGITEPDKVLFDIIDDHRYPSWFLRYPKANTSSLIHRDVFNSDHYSQRGKGTFTCVINLEGTGQFDVWSCVRPPTNKDDEFLEDRLKDVEKKTFMFQNEICDFLIFRSSYLHQATSLSANRHVLQFQFHF